MELNKIYNVECVEGMRKHLKDKSIDLTVTSPPYDDLRKYNGYSFDFESVAKELYRVTKEGGVVVWVVGDKTHKGSETGTSFKQALFFKEIGFNIHDTMIYAKKSAVFPDKLRYNNTFEYMFVLSKGKPIKINLIADKLNTQYGGRVTGSQRMVDGTLDKNRSRLGEPIKKYGIRNNVWLIDTGFMKTTKDKFAYEHPAMFPEQLASDHIISWSNENDVVLDPFMGSGTTAKMAKLNKRDFVGFEMSEEYCEIAERRINEASSSC